MAGRIGANPSLLLVHQSGLVKVCRPTCRLIPKRKAPPQKQRTICVIISDTWRPRRRGLALGDLLRPLKDGLVPQDAAELAQVGDKLVDEVLHCRTQVFPI